MSNAIVFPKESEEWKLKRGSLYIHPENGRFIQKCVGGYRYLPYGTKVYPITDTKEKQNEM